jgi:hypothetical protein
VEKGPPAVIPCGHEDSVDDRSPQRGAWVQTKARPERAQRSGRTPRTRRHSWCRLPGSPGLIGWEAERAAQMAAEAARCREEHRRERHARLTRARRRGGVTRWHERCARDAHALGTDHAGTGKREPGENGRPRPGCRKRAQPAAPSTASGCDRAAARTIYPRNFETKPEFCRSWLTSISTESRLSRSVPLGI